jgi:ribosomal protein S19E (S16A)
MSQPKLTELQKKVMKWIGRGWIGEPGQASGVYVNGKRMCNVQTMKALERAGYVSSDQDHCWKATDDGRSITQRLCL